MHMTAKLELGVRVQRTQSLVGEPIPVAVTLGSGGADEAHVDPDATFRTEFTLRRVGEAAEERKLTEAAAWVARTGNRFARPERNEVALPPGEEVVLEEDLAQMAVPPLEAGSYRVT